MKASVAFTPMLSEFGSVGKADDMRAEATVKQSQTMLLWILSSDILQGDNRSDEFK